MTVALKKDRSVCFTEIMNKYAPNMSFQLWLFHVSTVTSEKLIKIGSNGISLLSPHPELHTVTAQVIFHYPLLLVKPDLVVAIRVSTRCGYVCAAHLLCKF